MKLNLGCGHDIKSGYLNVDFRKTHPSVQVQDLSKFPWPWADRSASEILMLDFLEHFPYAHTQTILLECYRILIDDGEVVVQVPDGLHLARALSGEGEYLCNRCENPMYNAEGNLTKCEHCGQGLNEIAYAAMRRLYGGQDYAGNFHQTVFTERLLVMNAEQAGLKFIRFEENDHQWRNWNMKVVFGKGSIW